MCMRKLGWVGLYAVSMAYVEAAVVIYLRELWGIDDLVVDLPPFNTMIAGVELGRELATLVMLLAVGWAAGKTLQARLGFATFAFGIWDLGYYAWLKLLIGWPRSLLEVDFLFAIPLPWWGPVLAPALIALLMAASGALAVVSADRGHAVRLSHATGAALILGMGLVLYSFMADALSVLPATADILSQIKPGPFGWPPYLIGLSLLTWAALRATWPTSARPAAPMGNAPHIFRRYRPLRRRRESTTTPRQI